ncbi:DnaA N-terminal domain-containing protein [Plastorhodobacter daqingensis]|uniref:DnaA N-terminal domain-containing protein n=1 Tax=Plastorhodobacter daqingensis TaxID=1387281 RepID=A0ABW2UMI4_9RHOB
MTVIRAVGPRAASRKYDLLTALGAYALAQGKQEQRLVLRLLTLITARYNWARDELAVGQREIARLWSVDERTVKREMARLRDLGWLRLRRQASRGRVAEYALATDVILTATRAYWAAVGSDFEARLSGRPEDSPAPVSPGAEVLPFPAAASPRGQEDRSLWGRVRQRLRGQDPALFATWIDRLQFAGAGEGRIALRAPTAFHASYVRTHLAVRLLAACQAEDRGIRILDLSAADPA